MPSSNDEQSDDNNDQKSDKKGINNLTKILIGLGAIILVVGVVRWIYLRQANSATDQYWA
jgi:hypothetical protein